MGTFLAHACHVVDFTSDLIVVSLSFSVLLPIFGR